MKERGKNGRKERKKEESICSVSLEPLFAKT